MGVDLSTKALHCAWGAPGEAPTRSVVPLGQAAAEDRVAGAYGGLGALLRAADRPGVGLALLVVERPFLVRNARSVLALAQVEGAVMMGLGPALFEAIDFAGGRIRNAGLGSYRVPRLADLPEVEVILLDQPDIPPAGGGETPIIAVAPAIGNAIFRACGVRLRSMPLAPDGRVPAAAPSGSAAREGRG